MLTHRVTADQIAHVLCQDNKLPTAYLLRILAQGSETVEWFSWYGCRMCFFLFGMSGVFSGAPILDAQCWGKRWIWHLLQIWSPRRLSRVRHEIIHPFFELCEALLLGILFLFRTRTVLEKALTCSTKDCSAAKVFQKFLGQRIDLEFS